MRNLLLSTTTAALLFLGTLPAPADAAGLCNDEVSQYRTEDGRDYTRRTQCFVAVGEGEWLVCYNYRDFYHENETGWSQHDSCEQGIREP